MSTLFGLKNGPGPKRDCPPELPRRLEAFRALRGRLETAQDASETPPRHDFGDNVHDFDVMFGSFLASSATLLLTTVLDAILDEFPQQTAKPRKII